MAWLRLFRSHFAIYYRGPTFVLFYSSSRRRSPSWPFRSYRILMLWLLSRLRLSLCLLFHQHQRNQLRQSSASRSSSASGARSTRRGLLHHVFFSFSLVSSLLSPFSVLFPVYSIVACQFACKFLFLFYISSCVLLNLVLCCPFDSLLLFAMRVSVFSVWPCVRLLQMFGRVFGCCKCLAVCSAVRSIWQ